MNTIPPNDFSYYEMLNEVVQQEPATSLDAELMGPLAAIGIVKGKPFAPDARMKKILTEAVALANATSRTLFMAPRDANWYYYPGSGWQNLLFDQRLRVRDADPGNYARGRQTLPAHRLPHAGCADVLLLRRHRHHARDGHAPDRHRLAVPWTMVDADKNPFDGAKTYKVTLPKDIPEANFWSFTVYDNQTRSMLDTPQRYPRAGSQSYPVARRRSDADGTTTVYFSPTQPAESNGATGFRPCPARVFPVPAPLQPARTVLHQEVAAERGRTGSVSCVCPKPIISTKGE